MVTNMTKILHVYKDYYPVLGGMENHIKVLCEALATRGYDVTVLVTHPTSTTHVEDRNGVHVIKAGRLATVASTPISIALPELLRRQQPDITHLHFPYPLGEVANLVFGRAPHTVITYQSDVVRQRGLLQLYRPLLWRVLRSADRIIATTPNYIASSPFLSQLRDKCTVIPLGLPVERFSTAPRDQVQRIRNTYGTPLLLFVGRLRYYKGLQYLLRAMPGIPATLLVVGSGPMGAEWQQLSSSLDLTQKVIFVGEVSDEDLPAYYHVCDVFVLPASERSEAYGLVQIEAMASGRPVVCTELGTGTSWVNLHGKTGLVVPPQDPDALQDAIVALLRDESLRGHMGQQARQRAFEEFNVETMVDRITSLYTELLSA